MAPIFPTLPPSLSGEAHEMRAYYDTQQHQLPARDNVHSVDDLTPYLGLRARLSQVWLNKWTILILLVLARILLLLGSLHDDIDKAQAKALSACISVEVMGSTMASMPHYLAQGTNELAATGITKTVNGLEQVLFMALTAVEQIFLFVINMMYGTYECLITFAVTGTTRAAIGLIEDATKAINDSIADITNDINNGIQSFDGALNSFINGISQVGSIFGGGDPQPKLDISAPLTALGRIQIPGSINDELNKINSSIPSFDEVHDFTNKVLSLPFEEVRKLLNETLGTYTFDQSIFQVPPKQTLDFCTADANSGIVNFFGSLYNVADTARKVFIAVLVLAAILACIPFALLEIRRWRKMNERAKLIRTGTHEPLDVIYIVSRPVTANVGLKVANRFGSPKRQALTRWFIAYITSTPALLVFAIALAGLFSCLCQYILLKAIEKQVPALAAQVGEFADKVVFALNDASTEWANTTNSAIIAENVKLNDDVFGWVNTTTTALNDTLNTFVNQTTSAIDKVFGGTLLEDPVKEIFKCLIGLKVAAVQSGLTWAHDHAHVDFPLFPDDVFSAGASKALAADDNSTGTNADGDSFLAEPGSDASDAITGAVITLTEKLTGAIEQEALIAAGVLLCYIAVVIIGAGWTMFQCCFSRSTLRGNGGASYAGDLNPATDSPPLQQGTFTGSTTRNVSAGSHQPIVKNTSAGPVYDWGSKSDALVPNTAADNRRQSRGVVGVGSHDDKFDEKRF